MFDVVQSATVDPFPSKLRWWRRRRGLTQHNLATRAGLSRSYLARVETARHDPTLTVLRKLAKALRVDIAKLLR